ncbi:hypothetical protein D356_01159 [Enterococcus faecium SD2A-2]|uniref:Uncharacterized protein n=1 Tax=Enterococcus faecium SD2A-2 TaxID=1244154 RepID=A0AB73AA34_ENTFC|nr:hypothetical protein D356_01159 [Enterococcus faecium SD2A-2]
MFHFLHSFLLDKKVRLSNKITFSLLYHRLREASKDKILSKKMKNGKTP